MCGRCQTVLVRVEFHEKYVDVLRRARLGQRHLPPRMPSGPIVLNARKMTTTTIVPNENGEPSRTVWERVKVNETSVTLSCPKCRKQPPYSRTRAKLIGLAKTGRLTGTVTLD